MTQLAKLMIYRYDVFNGHSKRSLSTQRSSNPHEAKNKRGGPQDRKNRMESLASKQYFDAADDMLTIVHRSCDDHIRYINPFLSNTIWLASAVQLVRSRLCQSEVERSATKSRFEVMHLTYKKCVEFWDMHTAVQQNLEMLEEQLEAHRGSSVNRGQDLSTDVFGTCYVQTGRRSLDNQLPNEEPISPAGPESAHSAGVPNELPAFYMHRASDMNAGRQSRHPAEPFPSPISSSDVCMMVDQAETLPSSLGTRAPNASTPYYACLPENIARSTTSNQALQSSTKSIDPTHNRLQSYDPLTDISRLPENGLHIDRGQPQLPSDIQDLLSLFFT